MKRPTPIQSLFMVALFLSVVGLSAQAPAPKNHAQALVDRVVAEHPGVLEFALHAVASGAAESAIVASNFGRTGQKDGEKERDVFRHNQPATQALKDQGKFKVLMPLLAVPGRPVGVMSAVFQWGTEDDETRPLAEAARIRSSLQRKLFSLEDLLRPADGPAATVREQLRQLE